VKSEAQYRKKAWKSKRYSICTPFSKQKVFISNFYLNIKFYSKKTAETRQLPQIFNPKPRSFYCPVAKTWYFLDAVAASPIFWVSGNLRASSRSAPWIFMTIYFAI
jgi:hypothetical protein